MLVFSFQVTSQHPYCEEFISSPYVYTIDMKNVSEVERVMKEIMLKEVEPYLPFEFTHEGMLERVSALVQNQVRVRFFFYFCLACCRRVLPNGIRSRKISRGT